VHPHPIGLDVPLIIPSSFVVIVVVVFFVVIISTSW
jgi:hypothetical protein